MGSGRVKELFNMSRFCSRILFSVLLPLGAAHASFGQELNPLEGDPRAARVGGSIFRAQCATCHGADARGIDSIDAPDLTQIFTRAGSTDDYVFQTIREGIPGSIMPPHAFPDTEIWMLVSYLRSVGVSGFSGQVQGDPDRGKDLFSENCETCHRINGHGGSLGPNLSMIAAVRSEDAITNSIRDPSAIIGRQYKPVSILTEENDRFRGIIKSEDAFSIQVLGTNQELRGFRKSTLHELVYEDQSVMTTFNESALNNRELTDILSYLQSNL